MQYSRIALAESRFSKYSAAEPGVVHRGCVLGEGI